MKTFYCTHCGTPKLVGARALSGYSQSTGKKQYFIITQCPKKKWYNLHDSGYNADYGVLEEDEVKNLGIKIKE